MANSLRHPIKLYPQPPFSPHREPPSDESDFPPIRILRNVDSSSPIQIHEYVSAVMSDVDSSLIHDRASKPAPMPNPPTKLTGRRIHPEVQPLPQSNLKLKRRRTGGSPQDGQHCSKRKRITFDKDDMDWLKDELRDIKFEIGEIRTCIKEIAEHLQGEVDVKLEVILGRIEQL